MCARVCAFFTKVTVSDAGLEGRQEVTTLLWVLEQEAGVPCVGQVQVHSKLVWRWRH